MTMNKAELKSLLDHVRRETTVRPYSCHGPDHWARVMRNALYLTQHSDANPLVVRLFALLHDCRRLDDGYDPEHGPRAAEYAASLRGRLLTLEDEAFGELQYALRWHTAGNRVLSDTIGVCWDADRLDLGRVGIRPDPQYLYTSEAKRIAAHADWAALRS